MLPKYSLPIVCLVLVSQSSMLAAARQWTSSDGKFKVEADLVAYDGQVVELKKADGRTIKVPALKLSAPDREFLKQFKGLAAPAAPALAAKLPASVIQFEKAMDAMREIESKRIEGRIAELQKQLRFGAVEAKHPLAQEAKLLTRSLTQRLALVKSGKPFLPRISPKDFSVGQIGELDDDLLFHSSGAVGKDGTVGIGVLFDTILFKEKLPVPPIAWHHSRVSRPDQFFLRADFAANLPPMMKDFERTSPMERLLRTHVYEVTTSQPRGAVTDYVLAQFNMDEVSIWLKDPANHRQK